MVYIQEAHPSDGWQLPINVRRKVVFASPKSFEDRAAVANVCVRKLAIQLPALIDDIKNSRGWLRQKRLDPPPQRFRSGYAQKLWQ